VNAVLEYAKLEKFTEVALDSVIDKIAFYKGLGFQLRKDCSSLRSGSSISPIVPVLEEFKRDSEGVASYRQLEIMQKAGLNKNKDGECRRTDLKAAEIVDNYCGDGGYTMHNCDLNPVEKKDEGLKAGFHSPKRRNSAKRSPTRKAVRKSPKRKSHSSSYSSSPMRKRIMRRNKSPLRKVVKN
jgi:hypothetical protein